MSNNGRMQRHVRSRIAVDVHEAADLTFSIAVAAGPSVREESLVLTRDGNPLTAEEITGPHGTRLHQVQADPGALVVE
ncbi:hypothetical protein, partial [Nocardioides stalactiti]|uniref:hypothetical protein n=1 Tax=Nocardioides stalactiti TaxID=2755356 RepID=UPI001C80294B